MVARTYTSLPPLVDNWFQFLFHSPPGVLFTFPSRYLFTIGHQVVFSLTQWSGQIPTEFHVLCSTWERLSYLIELFIYRAITFFGCSFQSYSIKFILISQKLQFLDKSPRYLYNATLVGLTHYRFGLLPFRSPLLRESRCFIFLALLRCFSSRRSLLLSYVFRYKFLGFSKKGFPIRTSPDQSFIDSSPKLMAVLRLLHRLLMPRHPPKALYN